MWAGDRGCWEGGGRGACGVVGEWGKGRVRGGWGAKETDAVVGGQVGATEQEGRLGAVARRRVHVAGGRSVGLGARGVAQQPCGTRRYSSTLARRPSAPTPQVQLPSWGVERWCTTVMLCGIVLSSDCGSHSPSEGMQHQPLTLRKPVPEPVRT